MSIDPTVEPDEVQDPDAVRDAGTEATPPPDDDEEGGEEP